MEKVIYEVGDLVTLKKPHPCGSKQWEILRVGADFRLKCALQVLIPLNREWKPTFVNREDLFFREYRYLHTSIFNYRNQRNMIAMVGEVNDFFIRQVIATFFELPRRYYF